jgi:hypothetical protein
MEPQASIFYKLHLQEGFSFSFVLMISGKDIDELAFMNQD